MRRQDACTQKNSISGPWCCYPTTLPLPAASGTIAHKAVQTPSAHGHTSVRNAEILNTTYSDASSPATAPWRRSANASCYSFPNRRTPANMRRQNFLTARSAASDTTDLLDARA